MEDLKNLRFVSYGANLAPILFPQWPRFVGYFTKLMLLGKTETRHHTTSLGVRATGRVS